MSSWIQFYVDHLALERRYSAHTVEAYRRDLEEFCSYLAAQHVEAPQQANHHDVRGWLLSLTEGGMAARSINRKIAALRGFYTYLRRQGQVAASPMQTVKPLRMPSRTARFVPEGHTAFAPDVPQNQPPLIILRDALLLELLYGTGMRRAELIGLTVGAFDAQKATLRILGKRAKVRMVPLHTRLVELTRAYLAARTGGGPLPADAPLLVTESGAQLYPMLVQRVVKSALAHVPNLDKRSPHVLRHTFATHLLNAGAELNAIKELLGHASLAATQVYTHTSIERLLDVYKKAHPKGNSQL